MLLERLVAREYCTPAVVSGIPGATPIGGSRSLGCVIVREGMLRQARQKQIIVVEMGAMLAKWTDWREGLVQSQRSELKAFSDQEQSNVHCGLGLVNLREAAQSALALFFGDAVRADKAMAPRAKHLTALWD